MSTAPARNEPSAFHAFALLHAVLANLLLVALPIGAWRVITGNNSWMTAAPVLCFGAARLHCRVLQRSRAVEARRLEAMYERSATGESDQR